MMMWLFLLILLKLKIFFLLIFLFLFGGGLGGPLCPLPSNPLKFREFTPSIPETCPLLPLSPCSKSLLK